MYPFILFIHSLFRWLVVTSLLYAIYNACKGYASGKTFTAKDNAIRHWTATIAQVQLFIGFTLYFSSPVIKYLLANFKQASQQGSIAFFGIVHITLMFIAVILLTTGSALAKRKSSDKEKFRTMLIWFSVVLFIIFIAIPWPFSPFANRPYFRSF